MSPADNLDGRRCRGPGNSRNQADSGIVIPCVVQLTCCGVRDTLLGERHAGGCRAYGNTVSQLLPLSLFPHDGALTVAAQLLLVCHSAVHWQLYAQVSYEVRPLPPPPSLPVCAG